MNLIIRKNDSATSLLLFLYNNYMDRFSKDSIKLTDLLEILKVFGKSESAIRMSLSRATKAGILINEKNGKEVIYTLTSEAKKSIALWNEGVAQFWNRLQLRNLRWNNKWHFVSIEFNEYSKDNRVEILDKLQQFGFAQVGTNKWISPFQQFDNIKQLVETYGIGDSIIELYGDVKIHKDTRLFLDDIYKLNELRASYEIFVDIYKTKLKEVNDAYKEPSFIENGTALPILHELGWSFFEIAANDIILPKELMPQWIGDVAALIMRELRESLIEATYLYLEKFND